AIVDHARRGDVDLLTARVPDPNGLGPIVRDAAGGVKAIVENRHASAAERAINEINTGFIAAPTALLARWVAQLVPHNAQREYYLTDIVAMAVAEGVPVAAQLAADEREVRGVNDRAQLVFAERIIQTRKAQALLEAGTWIADPERIDIRGAFSCGRDVNFGAGSITANYDGANKHRTIIGDNVHIGSNCVLVAPIEIGAGATIGGGSTIVKGAPGSELTLARARQISIAGWQRPVKKPKMAK